MTWKDDLPSPEHRGYIRRFRGLDWLTDEQDVAPRGWVRWKRWNEASRCASDVSEHISCQENQKGENEENKAAVQRRRGQMKPVNETSENSD